MRVDREVKTYNGHRVRMCDWDEHACILQTQLLRLPGDGCVWPSRGAGVRQRP